MSEVIDKKQKLLIEYLLADKETFVQAVRMIKPDYFDKPLNRVMEFVIEFFKKHKGIADMDIIEAETGVKLKERELHYDDKAYMLEEMEKFCQESAMFAAITSSVDDVHEGKFHEVAVKVREALLVKLDNSIGVDVFEDAETRIEMTEENTDERAIGIREFDKLINKIRRGEVGIVYGSTGAGKSLMLMSFGRLLAEQGLDILIISLELDERLYAKRADTVLTGTDIREHKANAKIISQQYEDMKKTYGNITIKYMPHYTTASEIETVVMEYTIKYGKSPDAIMVDYLALMGVDGMGMKLVTDKFTADEFKIFSLQRIAKEYHMYMFTAGQLNREAEDVMKVNRSHVAGGVSAVNASDWSVAMVANEEMIENDEFQVIQLKIRNGAKTKQPVTLYRCPRSLRVSDTPFGNSPVTKKASEKSDKKTPASRVDKAKGKSKLKAAMNRFS